MTDYEIREQLEKSPDTGYRLLFDEYWNYVYTIVFHILRNCGCREDIEDCIIDVLTDVMMHYNPGYKGSMKAYIGTTAKRKAIDMKRSLTAESSHNVSIETDSITEMSSSENIEEQVENTELTQILLNKIEELGELDATIIIQKFFYDRNSIEISRILKMNPITVRSRCRRAIKRLRAALREIDITI